MLQVQVTKVLRKGSKVEIHMKELDQPRTPPIESISGVTLDMGGKMNGKKKTAKICGPISVVKYLGENMRVKTPAKKTGMSHNKIRINMWNLYEFGIGNSPTKSGQTTRIFVCGCSYKLQVIGEIPLFPHLCLITGE